MAIKAGTSSPDRITTLGFLALVGLVGTNLVAIRYSNRVMPPFWNADLRFALAGSLFALFVVIRRPAAPTRLDVVGSVVYGLLAFAAFFGLVYTGLVHVPAGVGQTVLALGPLLTLFMAAAIGLERLQVRSVVGALVAVGGIALIFSFQERTDVPLPSLLALVAGAASFASAGIVVKRLPPAEPVVRNAIAIWIGAVLLFGMSVLAGEPRTAPPTIESWVVLVYLVGPGTLVVFMLFLFLLRRWTATGVAYQFVLAPIVAIALGAIILDEPVTEITLVGAALVLAGVYVGAFAKAG
jgi:drug/metabolite transporter (DMT)-like permease